MSLLRSISTIAGSSIISQVIGAISIWLISDRYGMAEVGIYALTYSIVLIGAQVCTFASQLLLPKQSEEHLAQNLVFCLLQSVLLALPFTAVVVVLFERPFVLFYLLTVLHAWILISENLLLRDEKMSLLAIQRIFMSIIVVSTIFFSSQAQMFYWRWAVISLSCISLWLLYSTPFQKMRWKLWGWRENHRFFQQHRHHISRVGSAEVLAMANNNLPMVLINFWFSSVTAGYFAIVSRFCLSPVVIVGNAVRNSIFSKWSVDFRHQRFHFAEFVRVRKLLLILGSLATAGVFVCYPLVMDFAYAQQWVSHEWVESVPTSRYMLPYLFPALAVCPLTVIELVFGSPRYFLRIQFEQLAVVVVAFVVLPYFIPDYGLSVLAFALLSALRYGFIYLKVNQRANLLRKQEEAKHAQ
ncbi:lipopolysaccharide biosynthesis protein [Vibrio cincinnatiensis]|jgi:O-antigen/teichoic acid export membrane protein|uniref:lipopolysaccharide biosynthesis protein n=1 Tax=Vibrio cincinnatiensis TaxID=675 RepID=UPI001302A4EC|nr:capsular biosynthesis protein [Vibrio cincinnatiensis]